MNRIKRTKRLKDAHLYLICDARLETNDLERFLQSALSGGVDIVQLRDKEADDKQLLAAGEIFNRLCKEHNALFIVNDRPDLAVRLDADGVHLGQDDLPMAEAREIVGGERLIGISTHSTTQIVKAARADYIGVGPINATPTKPNRASVGYGLVAFAIENTPQPFFPIGGIDTENVEQLRRVGANRVAVVRAITEAEDPAAAAKTLRCAITGS